MREDGIALFIVEGYVTVVDHAVDVLERARVRTVHNLRLCLHDFKKPFETRKALLEHFCKLHQHLNRVDENVDVQRIGRQIHRVNLSGSDEVAARNENRQKEHALKEVVARMENTHALVVLLLRAQKFQIAFAEFFVLHALVGEGLDHTDSGQAILQACVDSGDLPAVVHENGAHFLVLPYAERQHDQRDGEQNERHRDVDPQEQRKGTENFEQGDEDIFRPMVSQFADIEEIGDQLAHHFAGVVPIVVGE